MSEEEQEFARYAAELPAPAVLDEYDRIVPDGRIRLLKLRRQYGSWEAVGEVFRTALDELERAHHFGTPGGESLPGPPGYHRLVNED